MAELSGILLGDGHIQSRCTKNETRDISTYFISITLNKKEKEIISNSRDLIKEVTGLKVKKYEKKGDCLRLVIHSKDAVQKFQEFGLKAGDKLENQVSAPEWIKESKKLSAKCLRGLIDTDGSIYKDKRQNTSYKRIQFSNCSKPLLEDFKEMCRLLGIKTVRGGSKQIQVSREDVEKFIEEIKPIKAQRL